LLHRGFNKGRRTVNIFITNCENTDRHTDQIGVL